MRGSRGDSSDHDNDYRGSIMFGANVVVVVVVSICFLFPLKWAR